MNSFNDQIPVPSPPHSHYSSSIYQSNLPDNNNEITPLTNGYTYGSKQQTTIASKYYARHRHLLKTNATTSQTSLPKNDSYPLSTLNTIQQE